MRTTMRYVKTDRTKYYITNPLFLYKTPEWTLKAHQGHEKVAVPPNDEL
jgi:hypothetical protein